MIFTIGRTRIKYADLIKLNVVICAVVMLLKDIAPAFGIISYAVDFFNVVLVAIAITEMRKKGIAKWPLIWIVVLIVFDIVECIVFHSNALMFLWGIRQQYRFIGLYFAAIVLCNEADIQNMYSLLYKLLTFNFVVVIFEALLGYRQDSLSGTFGIEAGSNGSANLFLVIVLVSLIVDYLYKRMNSKKIVLYLLGIFAWAAAAEIKYFFILAVLIVILNIFLTQKGKARKYLIAILGTVGIIAGIALLGSIYSYYKSFFNAESIMNYARNIGVGRGGFGRLTAIPISNDVFFKHNIFRELFGIGLGNAEYSELSFINSEFHRMYSAFNYDTIFYSMVYVERGWFGLVWYTGLFLMGIIQAIKLKKRRNVGINILLDKAIIVTVMLFFIAIYDDSMRRAFGGYIVFFLLATPYICASSKMTHSNLTNMLEEEHK